MFKKLGLMLLTVSCSYAMESLPTTPTGDNNMKQTVEDVKNSNITNTIEENKKYNEKNTGIANVQSTQDNKNSKQIVQIVTSINDKHVNKIVSLPNNRNIIKINIIRVKASTDEDNKISVINDIPEEFIYLNRYKIDQRSNNINNTNNIQISASKNTNNIWCSNINKTDAQNDSKPLFNFDSLKNKFFIDMTPDEQNWLQLIAYDMFSKSCQDFYQKILRQKELTDRDKEELFKAPGFTLCISADINPLRVLNDEIRFNLNPVCLMVSNLEKVQKQVWDFTDEVIRRTARIKARIVTFYKFKKLNRIADTQLALRTFLRCQQNRYRKNV